MRRGGGGGFTSIYSVRGAGSGPSNIVDAGYPMA
jgi:hypothetical protein